MLIKTSDFNMKTFGSAIDMEETKKIQDKSIKENEIINPRKTITTISPQKSHSINEIAIKTDDTIINTGYNILRVTSTGGLNLVNYITKLNYLLNHLLNYLLNY